MKWAVAMTRVTVAMTMTVGVMLALCAGAPGVRGADAEFLLPRFTPIERLAPERLRAVHEAREAFVRERRPVPELWGLEDYRAVIVHGDESDPARGTRDEVLAAARKTGVRVVVLAEPPGAKSKSKSKPKASVWRDSVLFLAGTMEPDGCLRISLEDDSGNPVIEGGLRFMCPWERLDADLKGYAGLEIVSPRADRKFDRRLDEHLSAAASDPEAWRRLTNGMALWPDEFFAAGTDFRAEILAKWDRELRLGRLAAIAGNEVRRNAVPGGVGFDPCEVSFRSLSTHILARELTGAEVLHALRDGHCYVSHDWLADPTGFVFGALNNLGVFPMGDTAPMQGKTRVVGLTPVPARQRLIFEGRVVAETNGTNLTFSAKKPGAYRLEAWLEVAGEWRPWIYSNPVHLEEQSVFKLPLPNAVESPQVEVRRDLVYTEGHPEHAAKHKLDLYVPRTPSASPAPVFLFVHGGAWRTGDRGLYAPVGQRFARDGILTVVPSYRLAPKSPWPAQAEDAAAAVAWTVRNIATHGGDTNRLFIGGHSAGGHLTSLLVFNDRYLRTHGLSASLLRGVISLSGVYDLEGGDAAASVFGRKAEVRRDASPLSGVRGPAPPFFVSYCEWDYPMLAAQAKGFHRELRKAGVDSRLFFTPRDNHIYEMLSLTHDSDETAQAVVRFIRDR